jgi:type IV pilus assembly protein PilY1
MTGSSLALTPFDVNGDGAFNANDQITTGGGKTTASGMQLNGMAGNPAIGDLANGNQLKTIQVGGALQTVSESGGAGSQRQSWRDLSGQ